MELEILHACPLCGRETISAVDRASNICECPSCAYVFDNPRPTVEELIRFYSQPEKYDPWLAQVEARDRLWARRLKLLLPLMKPGALLDIGAGIGQFLNHARPHFSSVCGTEVSASAIEIAWHKYRLNLLEGEVQDIDFEGAQFDTITLFHVLEHVPNPRRLLELCVRLLNPGGVLVVAVPNDVQSLRTFRNRLLRRLGVEPFQRLGRLGLPKLALDGSIAEIHLSHFTPRSLQRLIEQCGLIIVENTLDPYFVADGWAERKAQTLYACFRALRFFSGVNLYDTTLVVARKFKPGSYRQPENGHLTRPQR